MGINSNRLGAIYFFKPLIALMKSIFKWRNNHINYYTYYPQILNPESIYIHM